LGWWPLAILGIAMIVVLLEGRPARQRFWLAVVMGEGWFLPSTLWMVKFSPAGWPVGVALWFPLLLGVVALATPRRGGWLGFVGAYVFCEWFRWHAPFGGVPLSMLAMTQARGPLLMSARLVGTLGVSGAVALVGAALGAIALGRKIPGAIAIGSVVLVTMLGYVAPHGTAVRRIDAATVQGGGEQQTISHLTDYGEVFRRHADAANSIKPGVDLIVFPENITNINGRFEDTSERQQLETLAARTGATVVAGVVDDRNDQKHFWNFAVAISPRGKLEARYDKVRRVPFGEYTPMRSLLTPIAGSMIPPRDGVPGTKPALLTTSLGRLGVVISWEVFFPRRVADAMNHDAQILLNPTNGSSYWLTQVQTQQLASSTLRAVESGRWLLQSAPTGFSAIIDPDGTMVARSSLREAKVLQHVVELRDGSTIAMRLGQTPVLVLAGALLLLSQLRGRRGQPVDEPEVETGTAA
jgi:apolipoprotein N-acyltransferase